MRQFVLESRQKNVLFGLMGLGAVCLVLSYFIDPVPIAQGHHLRFWTNLLQNSAFFTGLAFTVTFVIAATITAYSGWHTAFKRVWESMSLFLPFGLLGILVVGVAGKMGVHHIYEWMDDKIVAGDKILTGKSGFLNMGFYLLAIGFGIVWYLFARLFRRLSLQQDAAGNDPSLGNYEKMKVWGAVFMPIAGFTSAAAIWLWLMSIDPHWYSTMFAWYTTASWWVSSVAFTILLLLYLKSKGYYEEVTTEHLHDLGKFLFAFSIFWTYLWFSQYMLIWYANIGEETIYFRQRMGEFPVLYYGNLIMNFFLPFLILIRNDTKRKWGSLAFASGLIFFGHWWDFFQMVKIGPYKRAISPEHGGGEHGAAGHGTEHGMEAANNAVIQGTQATHGATQHGTDVAHAVANHVEHAVETVKAGIETPATDALLATNNAEFFHYTPDMTSGYGIPGLIEIGIFLGFGAFFTWFVLKRLESTSLVPTSDPFLEETMHHEVEQKAGGHH
jgi:hypothetical protein